MQKLLLSIFILVGINNLSFGQQSDVLDVNNIRARVWCDGDLFTDKMGGQQFEFPIWSGKHSNSLSGLWITGKDYMGNLVGATTFDRANPFTNTDFYSGPLDTTCTNTVSNDTKLAYNRVWKINRSEIELFKLCNCINPSDPICDGYSAPNSIKDWPGNPILQAFGEHQFMAQQLAPYYDAAGDGFYDWTDCDYPLIRGDQAIFWVMNDQGGTHTVSGTSPMNVEIRAMAYASYCENIMNDVVFVDYDIINRCQQPITDVKIGMYSGADAGAANNDWVGTDVQKGFMYNYSLLSDAQYPTTAIATATILLQGPKMRPNGIDDEFDIVSIVSLTDTTTASGAYGVNGRFFNDAVADNEYLGLTRTVGFSNDTSIIGNPSMAAHFDNYLRGFWKDNSLMIYGGAGYPSGMLASSPHASFMFPHDSDPDDVGTQGMAQSYDWSEFNNGSSGNAPGDRKLVATTGPINLNANEHHKLTYAFMSSTQQSPSDSLGFQILAQKVDSIRAYWDSVFYFTQEFRFNDENYAQNVLCQSGSLLGTDDINDADILISVFPNPTKGLVQIQTNQLLFDGYELMDVSGRICKTETLVQPSSNISFNLNPLSNGMYYVILHSGNRTVSKKIIKD